MEAIQRMNDTSKQRKFSQSIELMINFKALNFKKPENQIDLKVIMPHSTGKIRGTSLLFAKTKEFAERVKEKVSRVILEDEIPKLKKKEVQQIIAEYDVLLAEGPVMLTVGKYLGQELAPKGKMPILVQSNIAEVERMLSTLGSTTRVTNKMGKFMPVVHVLIGTEKMEDEQIAENLITVYNTVLASLPGKKQNIKSLFVKKTMGPSIRLGAKEKGGEQ